jgi:hypothetical protein
MAATSMTKTAFIRLMDVKYRRVKWECTLMSSIRLHRVKGRGWLIGRAKRKGKIYWKVYPYSHVADPEMRTNDNWTQYLNLYTSEQLGIADDTRP